MSGSKKRRRPLRGVVAGLLLAAAAATAGCQVEVGGQTMPSPYYISDDIQYYQPGPEFKLAGEAAALEAAQQEQALRGR
jgi:hypothetical protein